MKNKYIRQFFICFVTAIFIFSLGNGLSFAEGRLRTVAQALDHYESWQAGAAPQSFSRADVSLDRFNHNELQLIAQNRPVVERSKRLSDILRDEEIPKELRQILENPEILQKEELPEEIDPGIDLSSKDSNFYPEDSNPSNSEEKINADLDDFISDELISDELIAGSNDDVDMESMMLDHLQLKNMDIVDVLKLFSIKSGLNIIAGNNIGGKVSIYLKNVKLKDALRIILDSNDLAYKQESGIIRVMTASEFERRYGKIFGRRAYTRFVHLMYAKVGDVAPILDQVKSSTGKIIIDEKSNTLVIMDTLEMLDVITELLKEMDIPVEVEVFDLNYALAKELVEKIEPILTEGIGNIKFDERSNKIIVTDVAERMEIVKRIVDAFDVRPAQVLIEAKIVQIELTDDYEFGIDWQGLFSSLDELTLSSKFSVISTAKKGSITVGTVDGNDSFLLVEALRQLGNTNILSSPSIMVLNNEEAKILVGTTEPYVTSTTTTSSSVATTADSVNFIEVGVKLYVTPTIHKDGFITMKVRPEVSSINDYLEVGDKGNKIPIVKTSEAETSVRIKDGVTIVIGGLIEDTKTDVRQKIPLLGDIPFFGAMFRNKDISNEKTEIAIFLTPTIISGEESLTPDISLFMDQDLK